MKEHHDNDRAWEIAECVIVGLIVVAALCLAVLVWINIRQELRERSAYNEGRYGVSREVALVLAERGLGKSADDLIRDNDAAGRRVDGEVR